MKKNYAISNLSFAFIANLVSLLGSTLLTLILPKFIGVSQYSYYQLYIFYAGYVGFLGFGCVEGIYLRYGGQYYEKLDFASLSAQLRLFSLFELVVSIFITIFAFVSGAVVEKQTVYVMFAFCTIIYLPRAFLHNLLQTTGRIREFAIGTIIDKLVHIIITIFGIVIKVDFFYWFVGSELIGRFCGGIYIFRACKRVVCHKPARVVDVKKDVAENLSAGLALMISNVASMLIVGVVRQGIEIYWNIETFGKISLTLSISNMIMLFINSVALVLFPMLKRADSKQLKPIYNIIRTSTMIPLFALLVIYYPARKILSMWLPHYGESLRYMAILFPLCIYESKMAMVVNTYLKAFRKERLLLFINLISVAISSVLTYIGCSILHNLDLLMITIVLVLAIRCTIGEYILGKLIDTRVLKDIIFEAILTVIFILFSWAIGGFKGTIIYFLSYVIYVVIKMPDIRNAVSFLRTKH